MFGITKYPSLYSNGESIPFIEPKKTNEEYCTEFDGATKILSFFNKVPVTLTKPKQKYVFGELLTM